MIPGNPLTQLAAAASVFRTAGSAFGKVAHGLGQICQPDSENGAGSAFAKALANDPHALSPETTAADPVDSARLLSDRIGEKLGLLGIEVNSGMQLIVNPDGTVEVQSDHPRAAEIEAVLREDQEIAKLVSTSDRHLPLPIILTATKPNTIMFERSGG
jgi:hypothetical protein